MKTTYIYDFIDPDFLRRFTYVDAKGVRRVKNPYKNREIMTIIVGQLNDSGDFILNLRKSLEGKGIVVSFPGGETYSHEVDIPTGVLTIKEIPLFTYVEVIIADPTPPKRSSADLEWDKLTYESQKALVAAWGDIDLLCNAIYPGTAESEFDFDKQNTLKWGLIAGRNNCTNFGRGVHDNLTIPSTDYYLPPTPKPKPPKIDILGKKVWVGEENPHISIVGKKVWIGSTNL